uniref:CCR4-NOT transcription complex subunit 11 n=1 Tax=Angiostrongylus cantonensis TaxID=6313 RepID=A0A0K0DBC9_ANGCA
MNGEQFQNFLTDLSKTSIRSNGHDDVEITKKLLDKWAHNTMLCANYITMLTFISGVLRQYALQYIPSFIGTYLYALSKRQQKSVAIFETFFLAVYNEEILEGGPGSDRLEKKVEEVRIPSIRYPSIYHDPAKINALTESIMTKPGNSPSVLVGLTLRVGPYPTFEAFTSQSKFTILTRIMKSVSLLFLATDVVSRHVCLVTISICESGFSFPETNFVSKVMDSQHSCEVIEDHSKKPRQHVNSAFLLELLTGVYMALFNGAPDVALRAIDAVHQRAQYEILADVILVSCSHYFLLRSFFLKWEKHFEKRRKGLVTTASLRIRKMPEDIPIQPELKEKEHSSILEEG